MSTTNHFATNIKYLRSTTNLSQQEFGKLFQLSRNQINHLEIGRKAADHPLLITFSEYFKVSIDDLLKKDLSAHPELISKGIQEPTPEHEKLAEELQIKTDQIKALETKVGDQ